MTEQRKQEFDEELNALGWIVQPHGHFNQNGDVACACRAGEEYRKALTNIKAWIDQQLIDRDELSGLLKKQWTLNGHTVICVADILNLLNQGESE
jgi:hypothetical protein